MARNVADLVDPPPVNKQPPVILTVPQAKEFLSLVNGTRWLPIYVIAITCGLREGEILGLHVEDIDFSQKVIHVTKSVQALPGRGLVISEPKTKNAIRNVSMPEFTVDVLRTYIDSLKEKQGVLFPTASGNPISPRNLLRHFHQKLGLLKIPKMPFHSLRHLHASLLLSANVHPKVVQSRLGHSTVLLTLDTYSHLLPGMKDEAAEKIDDVFTA